MYMHKHSRYFRYSALERTRALIAAAIWSCAAAAEQAEQTKRPKRPRRETASRAAGRRAGAAAAHTTHSRRQATFHRGESGGERASERAARRRRSRGQMVATAAAATRAQTWRTVAECGCGRPRARPTPPSPPLHSRRRSNATRSVRQNPNVNNRIESAVGRSTITDALVCLYLPRSARTIRAPSHLRAPSSTRTLPLPLSRSHAPRSRPPVSVDETHSVSRLTQ